MVFSFFVSGHRGQASGTKCTTANLFVLVCRLCQPALVAADAPQPIGALILDDRVPVHVDGTWLISSPAGAERRLELQRRAENVTITVTASERASTATSTPVPADSPLPSPFDSSVAAGLTTGCSTFFNDFLTDATFKRCYPLSMLLRGSQSFFDAQRSMAFMSKVLDASCSANVTFCSNYLSGLARNLMLPSKCGLDYEAGQSVVVEAYRAAVAYAPLYQSTCLKKNETSYCYADYVTSKTNTSMIYFYSLPLNVRLPGGTKPTCDTCLQQTMSIFHSATADRNQPISTTYQSAAVKVNTICGSAFVNETLPEELVVSGNGGVRSVGLFTWPLFAFSLLVAGLASCLFG